MIYPRKIYKKIKAHIRSRQAIVITGMRRTGKTTLLKQILDDIHSENKQYFDLEKISDREFFDRKNYDAIILDLEQRGMDRKKKIYLGIDQIQFLPNIASVIKYLYDHYGIKFFATGSSSYYLKNLFSQSLAGRKVLFDLYPLDFGEFLVFKQIPSHDGGAAFFDDYSQDEYEGLHFYYEEFIAFGGFPEVVLARSHEAKREFLNDIISSYINIDIASLADFRKDKEIYQLIKMLAFRACTRIDYNKLSSLVGLSRHTTEAYIDFFEKTYLIARVPVFTHNVDREIVKSRKLYFCDNGLMSVLGEQSSGVKFENALFHQLHQRGDLRYYALKNGNEIDFVLNGKIALEAKESPTNADTKTLARLSMIAGIKKYRLIGRHKTPRFSQFIWGGHIR